VLIFQWFVISVIFLTKITFSKISHSPKTIYLQYVLLVILESFSFWNCGVFKCLYCCHECLHDVFCFAIYFRIDGISRTKVALSVLIQTFPVLYLQKKSLATNVCENVLPTLKQFTQKCVFKCHNTKQMWSKLEVMKKLHAKMNMHVVQSHVLWIIHSNCNRANTVKMNWKQNYGCEKFMHFCDSNSEITQMQQEVKEWHQRAEINCMQRTLHWSEWLEIMFSLSHFIV